MRRLGVLIAILCLAQAVPGESFRGPLSDLLTVTPIEAVERTGIGLETIVLVELGGDPRFLDAIDIELTAPPVVGDHAGALTITILGRVNIQDRSGVADVVGEHLLSQPLIRGGKSFYQVVLREDAAPDASPTVARIGGIVDPDSFPLAISIIARMKGLSQAMQNAEFGIAIRPVTRYIGAISVRYLLEDGTEFDVDSALAPGFELQIDGRRVEVESEYLLEPGLHRIRLRSERYEDQETTVGVDRGRTAMVSLPLNLALASVNYSAPRGSTVYVNGALLESASGDFTVPPGEHTIVVVLGDYSITRRFSVEERRVYSISVTMDISVEEIK